ncbi:MAG TPA: glycosyltransferase family 1 protein [Cyclobacteriaceae bacterium]|nr:glycosyltransferase family 1 protein [Cyclobacteriaceae bacterium]
MENLFRHVREALPDSVEPVVKELSWYSDGFLKRMALCVEAFFHQGDVNHVTGDINFIAIFLKRKTVLTVLDVGFMKHPHPLARWVLKWFWIILPTHRVGAVTTISNSAKEELLKYARVPAEKISVIYVPILPGFERDIKPFNKEKPVLLQVGTKGNKNLTRLIRAIRGISCRLEIVGELDESMRQLLKECSVDFSNSCNLSNKEIIEKYISADVICFTSTYEGFGMPIVEANAIGRVVVTSNILSMPEVGGDAAHYVDPFDVESIRAGIIKVIEDDSYRELLIRNGLLNVRRFDVHEIGRQYAELYHSVNTGLP